MYRNSTGDLFLFGGFGLVNQSSNVGLIAEMWKYNPTTNIW